MTAWSRRGAWGLVLGVLLSWLAALVLASVGVAPSAGGGAPLAGTGTGPGSGADEDGRHVVLIGIPGLTWDVVDEESTPTLARLAREGGTAALVLRGTHEVTCAADAWLTVGAGQRAATDVEGCVDADLDATPTTDRPSPVLVEEVVSGGSVDPVVWERWREAAQERSLGTQLGTLASLAEEAGTCVAAYGGEAYLGAAGPDGTVAVAGPVQSSRVGRPAVGEAASGATVCRVHLVSNPPVEAPPGTPAVSLQPGQTEGVVPAVPADVVDATVAEVEQGLPEGTTLVVAGLGHTARRAEAMALVVHPVGDGEGVSLASGSTRQRALVQLTDLAPTLLELAGAGGAAASSEGAALAGQPMVVARVGNAPVEEARDVAAGVSLAKSSVVPVMGALAVLVIPGLLVAGLLRRARLLVAVATFAMAVPVSTFLAGVVPWWRAGAPVVTLTLVVVGLAALVAGLALGGPWRRDPLAPAAVVAAVTLAVLGVDMICSARLGLVSVFGLQPVTAGRFYGQGNVGFGIALGAFLMLAGALLTWLGGRDDPETAEEDGPAEHLVDGSAGHPRQVSTEQHRAPDQASGTSRSLPAALAVALLGGAFVVVGAAPWGGADFGGVLAVVLATGLLTLAALGLRWTVGSMVGLASAGVLVAAAVMVLDWLRGSGSRTHLGDFVQSVIDGEALGIVTRKLDQSLGILVSYPVSWLAVVALGLVVLVVVRRPRWSAGLWRHSGLRPAWVAGLVAVVLAWALNDSGIAVVALALTVLIAAALTVLGRDLARR